jgi:hypothetical protein
MLIGAPSYRSEASLCFWSHFDRDRFLFCRFLTFLKMTDFENKKSAYQILQVFRYERSYFARKSSSISSTDSVLVLPGSTRNRTFGIRESTLAFAIIL